jgi:hypothetical protein
VRREFFKGPAGSAELFLCLMRGVARAARKPRWAEKTPQHLAELGSIFQAFPPLPHPVQRDSRDVVLSLQKVPEVFCISRF